MRAPSSVQDSSTVEPAVDQPLAKSIRRLVSCRLTHETHTTEQLGAIAPDDPTALARRVKRHDRITEAVVLSTCNRVEVYASARTPSDRDAALRAARDALGDPNEVRTAEELDVVEHLARVACGLDSKVLGEDHVLGQVRRAFDRAADEGLAGGVLTRVADHAVSVGASVREETAINEGHVSYGSATCEAIATAEPDPDRLVIVGAGEMATSVAKAAGHHWNARIDVVNRSPTDEVASEDGRYWPLPDLSTALSGADAVVTATGSPEPVLTTETVAALDLDVPIVDLANPQDVAADVREKRLVTSLDAIQGRVDATVDRRRLAVPTVESRLSDAIERFCTHERESDAEDTLRALHGQAASIREAELERALNRLEAGDADPEAVLSDFASSLTGSLLGTPTDRLRAAARDGDDAVIDAAHRLFDLDSPDER